MKMVAHFRLTILLAIVLCSTPGKTQNHLAPSSLPPVYHALKTDQERMLFLEKGIRNAFDEGQLNQLMPWSRLGLALARKNKIDSLTGIFLFDIGKIYTFQYYLYDSAIYYFNQAIPFFPDKTSHYYMHSVCKIMENYTNLGNKDSALFYLDELTSATAYLAETSPLRIEFSQNIATTYQYFGMFKSAVQYFQLAVTGSRKNKNFNDLGLALGNLGVLYHEMDQNEKAVECLKESLPYIRDDNMPYMMGAANLAEFYVSLNQFDSANHYLKISNTLAEAIHNLECKLNNQIVQARIYVAQKNYSGADQLLTENHESIIQADNSWLLCQNLIHHSVLDTCLHRYADAQTRLANALDIATQNQFQIYVVAALQNLARVSSKIGDYRSAWKYQVKFMELKDSMASEKSKADLNDLEIKYSTLQKEQKIQMLQTENEANRISYQSSRRQLLLYLVLAVSAAVILGLVLYQRNLRNKIQTQRLKAELQTQILRSQMNPHFIFNCLNSIENFIMQNDKRSASDYLNKFSLLIRTILDSSRNEVVPLARDMEALALYIELEQLRFNYKFNCKTYTDPALAGGDYRVPSLLIQPYVENAIVHGLAHSEENNLNLTVTASLHGEAIKYTVQDNGVGRSKAKEYHQRNKPYHTSVGLKISEDRIRMFNFDRIENPVKFIDLYDEFNNPSGTKVEITIQAV